MLLAVNTKEKGALTAMLHQIRNLKKESKGAAQAGFTIIEVMIVLAVAGLIMAIVFLAIPALQRNARTNARNADARLILGAVNECLSNKNGDTTSCDANTEIDTFLDRTKLRELDETTTAAQVTVAGQTIGRTATSAPIDNLWRVSFNTQCNSAGDAGTIVTNKRQLAIMYGVENNQGRTVQRCIQG